MILVTVDLEVVVLISWNRTSIDGGCAAQFPRRALAAGQAEDERVADACSEKIGKEGPVEVLTAHLPMSSNNVSRIE